MMHGEHAANAALRAELIDFACGNGTGIRLLCGDGVNHAAMRIWLGFYAATHAHEGIRLHINY